MAISRVGGPTEITSAVDYSGAITVPSDTEILIIGVTGYDNTSDQVAIGATIDSAAMTKVLGAQTVDHFQGSIFYKFSPSTGTPTLSVDFGTLIAGAKIIYACYKGIDTSGIRDNDGMHDLTPDLFDTKTLTASTGDLIVAFLFASSGSDSVTGPTYQNLTQITAYNTRYNTAVAAWAENSPTGNVSVGLSDWTNAEDGGICAVVLKPAAAAASIEQEGFRFRNDDGSESAATWKANQDTNITLAANTTFRLRFLLKATGNPDSIDAQAEARVKPSGGAFGAWEKIN